jgi:hypothetical protein
MRSTIEKAFEGAAPGEAPKPATAATPPASAADAGSASDKPPHIVIGSISSTPQINGVERAIHARRPKLRTCYRTGLDEDATMTGKLTLRLKVQSNGEVSSSEVVQNSGLSPATAKCVALVYRNATFEPVEGEATVSIAASFAPSAPP